ncbi:MAG TPA: metallophosphoesterase [Candidatus Baltobacteraceae bacterium]|nr:metallophosphoesterase [Candidatus Baltobacteraceae bacterium]
MRRGDFVHHVAWTGAGIVYVLGTDGIARAADAAPRGGFAFAQISDSHIGYSGPANMDVRATFQHAIDAINALPQQPSFVIHTGDVTHLSKAREFDDARAMLSTLRAPLIALPGEHDVIGAEGPKRFAASFARNDAAGRGWSSWDQGGAHFVALVNVGEGETMGELGPEQLAWLRDDLAARSADTPIVVFGHVPLFAVYPAWGWTTRDGTAAIALLRRFSAVTVLNGHIHQVVEKRDGNIRFATARATGFPQAAPGAPGASPGPLAVAPGSLLGVLGFRTVELDRSAAWQDRSLADA